MGRIIRRQESSQQEENRAVTLVDNPPIICRENNQLAQQETTLPQLDMSTLQHQKDVSHPQDLCPPLTAPSVPRDHPQYQAGLNTPPYLTSSVVLQQTLSTKGKFDLIAEGTLDYESASQLLDELFKAQDYLTVLSEYSEAQKYIDGLYKVYAYCFCK